MTTNLEMRVFAHNNLPKGWTRKFRSWELIYKEEYLNKQEASEREMALKKVIRGGNSSEELLQTGNSPDQAHTPDFSYLRHIFPEVYLQLLTRILYV